MLSDALKTFRKMYAEYGDKLILDSYIPDDGEYIIVSYNEPFQILEKVSVKLDKKTRTIDRTNKYMDFICQADYYSKYLNSNKSVANKNIHSNNFLSFYTKIDAIQDMKVNDNEIIKYFDYFRYPEKRLKGKAKEKDRALYNDYTKRLGEVDIDIVNRIENWVKNNLFKLIDFNNGESSYKKSFVRILFHADLEEYRREGNRYFFTRIYNKNDYNVKVDGLVYGLPDNNISLDDKKPFLKNLTRKNEIPYYLSQEDVLMQKKLFDYLGNQFELGKRDIYFDGDLIMPKNKDETLKEDFSGTFFVLGKGKEGIEVLEYDNIIGYKYNINTIKFNNILGLANEKSNISYGDIYTIDELKKLINEVLFNNFLINNYFTEAKDIKIKDTMLKRNLVNNRVALFSWFYKGIDGNIWWQLEKSITELILSSISNNHFIKACERFNLKMALKNYFEGGNEMSDIAKKIKDILRDKINNSETEYIQGDDEYYFAVGQVISYFISLSKSGNKKLSLANTILNSKSDASNKELRNLI